MTTNRPEIIDRMPSVNPEIIPGSCESIASVSPANRLIMSPAGVDSKNDNGEFATPANSFACNTLEARRVIRKKT
jgi:hypothetical protein